MGYHTVCGQYSIIYTVPFGLSQREALSIASPIQNLKIVKRRNYYVSRLGVMSCR